MGGDVVDEPDVPPFDGGGELPACVIVVFDSGGVTVVVDNENTGKSPPKSNPVLDTPAGVVGADVLGVAPVPCINSSLDSDVARG
jgi:hypothetical protein